MMSWDEVFLSMSLDISKRSKDPSTQVGAVIVDPTNCVLAAGFNGPPRRAPDSNVPMTRPGKYGWFIHAEHNAILFALAARGRMLDNCLLYTSGLICSHCMLTAAQVGIQRVVCGPTRPHCCDQQDQALMKAIALSCRVEVET